MSADMRDRLYTAIRHDDVIVTYLVMKWDEDVGKGWRLVQSKPNDHALGKVPKIPISTVLYTPAGPGILSILPTSLSYVLPNLQHVGAPPSVK